MCHRVIPLILNSRNSLWTVAKCTITRLFQAMLHINVRFHSETSRYAVPLPPTTYGPFCTYSVLNKPPAR